jgi:hypothetical protein
MASRYHPGVSARQLIAVVALGWLLTGCGAGVIPGSTAASPSPTSAPTLSAEQAAAWRACGATSPPPAQALAEPTSLPAVANQTAGAVSDADARRWAAGFLREQAIEAWGQTALQDRLLSGPCLGDPIANATLFGDEIQKVQNAREKKATIDVKLARVLDVRVVAVPAQVQDQVARRLYAKSGYALVVHGRGPAYNKVVYPDGHQDVWAELKPDEVFYGFYGGEYRTDATRGGPLWYQKSVLNCQNDFLRAICGV